MVIPMLRDLARRGNAAAEALAHTLESVPGLADAVLRIANRIELPRGARIAGVQRAVVVLGARAVVEIALAVLEPGETSPLTDGRPTMEG
jgi:HD-like signal output (HDOD) protein